MHYLILLMQASEGSICEKCQDHSAEIASLEGKISTYYKFSDRYLKYFTVLNKVM
jgi:hypothetical protein